jgi:hypothetical protein
MWFFSSPFKPALNTRSPQGCQQSNTSGAAGCERGARWLSCLRRHCFRQCVLDGHLHSTRSSLKRTRSVPGLSPVSFLLSHPNGAPTTTASEKALLYFGNGEGTRGEELFVSSPLARRALPGHELLCVLYDYNADLSFLPLLQARPSPAHPPSTASLI